MNKSRNTTTARNLRHAFTCWMDAPLDDHKLNRLKSLQQHWELKARIDKLTTPGLSAMQQVSRGTA